MAAIYEQCRSELGQLWHGVVNMYGRLALAAPPRDINATADDAAFMSYGVKSMCDGFGWIGTFTQVFHHSLFLYSYDVTLYERGVIVYLNYDFV